MSNQKPIWAQNLRIARKKFKLTQQEVAEKIFKTQQAYNMYEAGDRMPDMATWILLCDVYGVTELIKFINTDYFKQESQQVA